MSRLLRLKGRREALQLDIARLEKTVGIAKARQEHKDAVDGVLDDLERRFHERSMGILESLLGAFLNDVLPRDPEMGEQSVMMSLDTQRGLPALQVAVRNGDHLEDALRGRGGSVANVLSAGLRFIAIARTGGRANTLQGVRPFLVLDEADCWLSPDRVPAFSEVIHSLTHDLGVQVLMISHHDTALLKGFPAHLERIGGEDGFPSVRVRHIPVNLEGGVGTEEMENGKLSEDSYTRLTGIRLENFLSHEDSLIPLTAGVTVLSGDNDVGKSAVTEAFRAIAYNDSSDAVIRHGASEARVSMMFADGTRITWTRTRKGSPKTVYRLFCADDADGGPARETPAPKDVPDWVRMMMGMDLREKMDVHIGDQKSPVFLLDQPPSQRAAILDIGRESQHLRVLRERWKQQVDDDRRTIRDGEKQLSVCRRSMSALVPMDDIEEEHTLYADIAARVTGLIEGLAAQRENVKRALILQKSAQACAALDAIRPVALPAPLDLNPGIRLWRAAGRLMDALRFTETMPDVRVPDFPDAKLLNVGIPLFQSSTRLLASTDLLEAQSLPVVPVIPVLPDWSYRQSLHDQCHSLQKRMHILEKYGDLPVMPQMDISALNVVAVRIVDGYRMGRQAIDLRKTIKQSEEEANQNLIECEQAEKAYQDKLHEFGVCPFCGAASTH